MRDQHSTLYDFRLFARRLSTLLIISGVAMALYVPATMAQGEWKKRQVASEYDDSIGALSQSLPEVQKSVGSSKYDYGPAARKLQNNLKEGQPFGRLRVPAIGVDEIVVAGAEELSLDGLDDTLRAGPAHIRWSSLPGLGSNTAIAGHRTTFTRPFWSLIDLDDGDKIILEVPYGTFTYRIDKTLEVFPSQVEVTKDRGREEITLSTCTPRFTAALRFIVHGKLIKAVPKKQKQAKA